MSMALSLTSLAVSLAACAGAAVFAVKARAMRIQAQKDTAPASGGRPTHADGTPYRYHKIVAEGWGHCDGCRQWGQWTIQDPHDCQHTINVTVAAGDPAAIGADVARILRRTRRDDIF